MKRRISRVLNFVAFNLLFFALYLNFIHEDNNNQFDTTPQPVQTQGVVKGNILIENSDQYLKKNNETNPMSTNHSALSNNSEALKLSFN